jgi:hypothetical protein
MRMMRGHAAFTRAIPGWPFIRYCWVTLCLCLAASHCPAQNVPTEHQIKAAFIFNFAKLVDWPAQANPVADSPVTIGVLGDNVFHDDLANAISGKNVNNHPLHFEQCGSLADATNCQILFISPSEKSHFTKLIDQLHNSAILTVSETDQFIDDGGMINFVIVDKKVRFQINNDAAKKAGLTISSKLLSLAVH